MTLTNTLGLELPRALPAPRFWNPLLAARDDGRELPIAIRADEPFEALTAYAAAPERFVEEDAGGITWWLRIPAAGCNNTELVWDPQRRKLSVGTWSRNVTERGPHAVRHDRSPGRLLWHSALWRPDVDGARATARLERGWIRVRMPRRSSR